MSKILQNAAYDVLRIRDYRSFIIARTGITFGVTILGTAVGWQVYELTKDAFSLGLIGLAEFIPFLIVSLIGGYVADVFNRKKVIITCLAVYSLCAFSLYLLSKDLAYIVDTHGVFSIYVLVGATGLVRGFLGPSQSAFATQLVPKHLFTNAATWSTLSWQLSAVGGPAIGGLLCAFSKSAWSSYLAAMCLALLGLTLILTIASRHNSVQNTEGVDLTDTPPLEKPVKEPFLTSVQSGFKFVFKKQLLLSALSLDMFAVLFGGAVALLPAFAKDILAVGPEGFGALRAAPAVGALIMGSILVYNPPGKNAGKWLLVAVAGFGVCTILFAVSRNFYFSLLMLAGTGFFDNFSMVIRGTITQLFTPNDMRGRVSAVNSLFIGSSNELGAFESGAAAKVMGLTPSVIFGGVMTLIVVTITWIRAPKLRDLDL